MNKSDDVWSWNWAPRSRIGSTCPACGRIHCGTDARAVGRFNPSGPDGYRADFEGSPLRPTRVAAMSDMCQRMLDES